MTSRLQSPKQKVGVAIGGVLLIVAAGWFLLVSPQRSKVTELDAQIASSQADLAQRRLAAAKPSADVTVKPSDLYRLTKALPSGSDMAGILLDVNRLANRNALEFNSVTPATDTLGSGYVQHPLSVVVQGRFSNVSRFLGDIRSLVGVKKGRLNARGRLYSVSQVDITEPDPGQKFPVVKATVMLNAYEFSAPPPTSPDPTTAADTSSPGTVAAGATP